MPDVPVTDWPESPSSKGKHHYLDPRGNICKNCGEDIHRSLNMPSGSWVHDHGGVLCIDPEQRAGPQYSKDIEARPVTAMRADNDPRGPDDDPWGEYIEYGQQTHDRDHQDIDDRRGWSYPLPQFAVNRMYYHLVSYHGMHGDPRIGDDDADLDPGNIMHFFRQHHDNEGTPTGSMTVHKTASTPNLEDHLRDYHNVVWDVDEFSAGAGWVHQHSGVYLVNQGHEGQEFVHDHAHARFDSLWQPKKYHLHADDGTIIDRSGPPAHGDPRWGHIASDPEPYTPEEGDYVIDDAGIGQLGTRGKHWDVDKTADCPRCKGYGAESRLENDPRFDPECPTCEGRGEVVRTDDELSEARHQAIDEHMKKEGFFPGVWHAENDAPLEDWRLCDHYKETNDPRFEGFRYKARRQPDDPRGDDYRCVNCGGPIELNYYWVHSDTKGHNCPNSLWENANPGDEAAEDASHMLRHGYRSRIDPRGPERSTCQNCGQPCHLQFHDKFWVHDDTSDMFHPLYHATRRGLDCDLFDSNGDRPYISPLDKDRPPEQREASIEDDHKPSYEPTGFIDGIPYSIASCSCSWKTNIRSQAASEAAWARHFKGVDEEGRREQAGEPREDAFVPRPTKRWGPVESASKPKCINCGLALDAYNNAISGWRFYHTDTGQARCQMEGRLPGWADPRYDNTPREKIKIFGPDNNRPEEEAIGRPRDQWFKRRASVSNGCERCGGWGTIQIPRTMPRSVDPRNSQELGSSYGVDPSEWGALAPDNPRNLQPGQWSVQMLCPECKGVNSSEWWKKSKVAMEGYPSEDLTSSRELHPKVADWLAKQGINTHLHEDPNIVSDAGEPDDDAYSSTDNHIFHHPDIDQDRLDAVALHEAGHSLQVRNYRFDEGGRDTIAYEQQAWDVARQVHDHLGLNIPQEKWDAMANEGVGTYKKMYNRHVPERLRFPLAHKAGDPRYGDWAWPSEKAGTSPEEQWKWAQDHLVNEHGVDRSTIPVGKMEDWGYDKPVAVIGPELWASYMKHHELPNKESHREGDPRYDVWRQPELGDANYVQRRQWMQDHLVGEHGADASKIPVDPFADSPNPALFNAYLENHRYEKDAALTPEQRGPREPDDPRGHVVLPKKPRGGMKFHLLEWHNIDRDDPWYSTSEWADSMDDEHYAIHEGSGDNPGFDGIDTSNHRHAAWIDHVTSPVDPAALPQEEESDSPRLPPLYEGGYQIWPDQPEAERTPRAPANVLSGPKTGQMVSWDPHQWDHDHIDTDLDEWSHLLQHHQTGDPRLHSNSYELSEGYEPDDDEWAFYHKMFTKGHKFDEGRGGYIHTTTKASGLNGIDHDADHKDIESDLEKWYHLLLSHGEGDPRFGRNPHEIVDHHPDDQEWQFILNKFNQLHKPGSNGFIHTGTLNAENAWRKRPRNQWTCPNCGGPAGPREPGDPRFTERQTKYRYCEDCDTECTSCGYINNDKDLEEAYTGHEKGDPRHEPIDWENYSPQCLACGNLLSD